MVLQGKAKFIEEQYGKESKKEIEYYLFVLY